MVSQKIRSSVIGATHLKPIYGEAVIGLQPVLRRTGLCGRGKFMADMRYFNEADGNARATSIDSMVGIQIISSGPDTQTRQTDNYLELFHVKARHHIISRHVLCAG